MTEWSLIAAEHGVHEAGYIAGFWVQLAIAIVSLIITFLLRPKPPQNTIKAQKFEGPKTEEGAPIPVIFGCAHVKAPEVVWLGDKSTEAIKSKGGKK